MEYDKINKYGRDKKIKRCNVSVQLLIHLLDTMPNNIKKTVKGMIIDKNTKFINSNTLSVVLKN